MKGEGVWFRVFDLAASLDLDAVDHLFGAPVIRSRRSGWSPRPEYAPHVHSVRSAPGIIQRGSEVEGCRIDVALHAVGAVSVQIRVPFECQDLAALHDWKETVSFHGLSVSSMAQTVFEDVRDTIQSALKDTYDVKVEPEPYFVFVLTQDAPSPDALLREHRGVVAALIEGEPPAVALSDDTMDRVLKHRISYRPDDLFIAAWDRGVLATADERYEDVLDVVELANVELLALRAYDAYIESRMGPAFASLDALWARRGLFRSARGVLRDMTALRMEFEQMTDDLRDTQKMFGDWYLALLHDHLRDCFHMREWEASVADKMEALRQMFGIAGDEAHSRRGFVMETAIVVLFVIDLVAIIFGH